MNSKELTATMKILETFSLSGIFPQDVLIQSTYLYFLSKEQVVISSEPYDALYLILNGRAFVTSYSASGDKVIIDTLEAGEFFGDIELYSDAIFSLHNVVAAPDAQVLKISRKLVEEKLNQHVPFLNFMCKKLTEKLMNTSFNYSKSLLLPAKNKLARYIVDQYALAQNLEIPFSVKSISEILGISDRHLRRMIQDFEQKKLLIKYRSSMKLLDLEELTNLANG